MNCKKILNVFMFFLLVFSGHLVTANFIHSAEDINSKNNEIIYKQIREIMERQQKLKKFQSDINLIIESSFQQKSTFYFTYYYHEPDLVYLKTDGFVLLPTEPLKSLQPGFFKLENYQLDLIDKTNSLYLFRLVPRNSKKDYYIEIWIDPENKKIKTSQIFFAIPTYKKQFSLTVKYQQICDYSMPVTIQGEISIPTKFGSQGKIKEFKPGYFDMKLNNYKINQEFPRTIMDKLSN